jgi:hypothetical protein
MPQSYQKKFRAGVDIPGRDLLTYEVFDLLRRFSGG